MSDVLKPYPAYKDSSVPWIGDVPAHWEVLPHRALFQEVNDRNHPDEPLLSVTIARGVIPQKALLTDSSKKDSSNLDKSNYKRVQPGDIAYNKMRAWQGAIGVSQYKGIVSPAYVIIRPRQQQAPEYYHYLLRTPGFIKEAERWSYGITSDMWSLRAEDFKRIYGVLPPPAEQRAIAAFLDHHDRLTRRYIHAQQRLIKLLTEQKQALIQQTVTRGLDPDAPLKDSGIAWLGKIPAHWDVVAVRLRYSVELGKMLDTKRITGEYLVPYLRNVDVQWDRVNTHDLPEMDITLDEYPRYTLLPGDMLVCEGGEVGRSAFWNGEIALCGYQKALHRLRPYNPAKDVPRFLYYVMYAVAKRGIFLAGGSENTIAHLTGEKLRRYRFAFPPFDEQNAIVSRLDVTVEKIDNAIARAQRQIDLIREYRTHLIADVVTGKVDVRGVVLPTDEETEAFDEVNEGFEDEVADADDLDTEEDVDADNGYQ